jgi:exoribonuclease R
MSNKIFGILHLSSRTVNTNDKGDIFKKFTPFVTNLKPFDVKTKKKTFSDTYCTVCLDTKVVLEYHENITSDNIPLILTKLYWKNFKKDLINIDEIKMIDLTPDRINLEPFVAYTIDPDGSLDRDDAIGIDIINKKIFIHIADPSSYIEKDSMLDKELSNRGQSIYLDKTFHMIMEPLSTEIISLTEGNKSRAFTLELTYDTMYNICSHKFYKSYIQVKNLTYEQAEKIIQDNTNLDLLELYKFGQHNLSDSKLYNSHKMVEVFMVLCNKYAAIEMKDLPSIIRYNNSPKVNLDTLDTLDTLDDLKLDKINPKLIEMWKISTNEAATYEINTEYNGHTLLGLNYYTHFSSPLRRYVDLVLHRSLYNKLCEKSEIYSTEELKNICTRINIINKNYKVAYNIFKLNNLMKNITILEIDCDLVYFDEKIIKLYYEKEEILLFVNLIHSKIKKIVDLKMNSEELIVESDSKEIIKLNLFQKVKIKIFKLKNNSNPFKITLIEPSFDFNLISI